MQLFLAVGERERKGFGRFRPPHRTDPSGAEQADAGGCARMGESKPRWESPLPGTGRAPCGAQAQAAGGTAELA